MAYVENPIAEGKDFDSVMNDVNGNFDSLLKYNNDIDPRIHNFEKIEEYKIETQLLSFGYKNSYHFCSSANQSIYRLVNGNWNLIESCDGSASVTSANYEKISLTQTLTLENNIYDEILLCVRTKSGRLGKVSIYGISVVVNNTELGDPVSNVRFILNDNGTATSPKIVDGFKHFNFVSNVNDTWSFSEKKRYNIIPKVRIVGEANAAYYSTVMDKDSSGKNVYFETYFKEHPEEFISTTYITLYAKKGADFVFNGVNLNNPWTET